MRPFFAVFARVFSVACLLCALPAMAGAPLTDAEVSTALERAMMIASNHSRLSARGVALPAFERVEPSVLQQRCGNPGNDTGACYLAVSRTLLLSTEFAIGTSFAMSYLVHEMTHHLQNVVVAPIAEMQCPADAERLAYKVQNRYNEGLRLPTFSEAQIKAFSTCDAAAGFTYGRASLATQ